MDRRRSKKLLPRPLVLIVCEGAETEPNYFNDIRSFKHIGKDRVRVVSGRSIFGTDPGNIVRSAKEKLREIYQSERLRIDEVWCVFDCDEHATLPSAFNEAKKLNYKVAFSNPCFELWFLLHFKYQSGHIERESVRRELKKSGRLPGYDKAMRNIWDSLHSRLGAAYDNADSLRIFHGQKSDPEIDPERANPTTGVDNLVRFLLGLKK